MMLRLLGWILLMLLLTTGAWWLAGAVFAADSARLVRFWLVIAMVFLALAGCAAVAGQVWYFLRRAAQVPVILAVIYLITFALVWLAPGDPFQRNDRANAKIVVERLRKDFHAETWYGFLAYYPARVLVTGDFGPSMNNPRLGVNQILRDHLPVSVMLGMCALGVSVVGGVFFGTLAAVRRDGPLDWFSVLLALVGISVPSFVVASLLVAVLAMWLQILPGDGWRPGTIRDMILPSFALSLLPMAYITRLTRVAMIDVLASDYVRTARAKGLSKFIVVWKHCLRNALLPVLSYIGPAAATTLVGSFVIEMVFVIPGLGMHFVESVKNRDQTLILGLVLVESALLLVLNLAVDILYGIFDPRIEVSE